MPGITTILPLKSRDPDNCVLLRFIKRFKSFDVIRKMGKTRFLDSYQVLVKKTKDRFAGSLMDLMALFLPQFSNSMISSMEK